MLDIKNRETLEIYVLGDDFKFYQNLKYLPLTSYPVSYTHLDVYKRQEQGDESYSGRYAKREPA